MLTAKRLREVISYDQDTGDFTWLVNCGTAKSGSPAGTIQGNGYLKIKVDGRLYYAHRLAWLHVAGEWPSDEIDHINGVRGDNRWANLRAANRSQNMRNIPLPSHNKSGIKGVSWDCANNKWRASIMIDKRQINLGRFINIHDAAEAYAKASLEYHGEFGRS